MFKDNDFLLKVFNKEGKSRTKKSKTHRLCIGNLHLTTASTKKDAIIHDFRSNELSFIEENCSKCFLCMIKNPSLNLDSNNYPELTKRKSNDIYFTLDDRIHFSTSLTKMKEDSGISKWITILFMLYGYKDVYRESSISSEYLNPEIKNEFKPEISNAVYQKGILADVEINENDFNIIFENKKSSKEDGWLKTAIGQIAMYASSEVYNKDLKTKYFVICYDGSKDEKTRIKKIISNHPFSLIKDAISANNKHFSVLNSMQIYEQVLHDLENNTIRKENLLKLIKDNVVDL